MTIDQMLASLLIANQMSIIELYFIKCFLYLLNLIFKFPQISLWAIDQREISFGGYNLWIIVTHAVYRDAFFLLYKWKFPENLLL